MEHPAESTANRAAFVWPDGRRSRALLTAIVAQKVTDDGFEGLVESGLLRFSTRREIARFIAHYELYKKVVDLPGHIIEMGVFRGESLLRFAQFAEIFNCYDRSFDIVGFDNFEGFTAFHGEDGTLDESRGKTYGGWSPGRSRQELYELIDHFDSMRLAPQKPRIRLIEGDIEKTAPAFKAEHPNLRVRLLHLDVDLYTPTLVALECFWDNLVVGGCLLLDEYAFDLFEGESAAVDRFFRDRGLDLVVRKFPFSDNPGGYVIKQQR